MIIDTHVHFGKIIGFDMPQEMVIESMEKYKIDYSIVSNCEAAEFDHEFNPVPIEYQRSQNDSFIDCINFARKYPEKIGVMPWIKPYNEGVTKEFEDIIVQNRDIVLGIKVHPYHSKIPFDSQEVQEYIKLARKYYLPVATHTGGSDEASPKRVYNMAQKYPDVDFIMVHMGLGTDNSEAIELISKLPNLYGDTAWVPIESTIKLIRKCGSHKIMFGSDNPIDGLDTYHNNPKGEISIYQSYFNELKKLISREEYENIMYKNAIRVFKIVNIGEL